MRISIAYKRGTNSSIQLKFLEMILWVMDPVSNNFIVRGEKVIARMCFSLKSVEAITEYNNQTKTFFAKSCCWKLKWTESSSQTFVHIPIFLTIALHHGIYWFKVAKTFLVCAYLPNVMLHQTTMSMFSQE